MNRRQFLSVSGSALIGGTATISNNQPVIGLDFSINGVSNEDASDTDNIVVEFSKLRLTPYYLKTSQTDVIITVDLSGGYSYSEEQRFEINLVNGETSKLVEDNIVDGILIPVGSVTGSFIEGNVTVEVSNEEISRSYSQSFVISDGVDSTGGTVTRKSIDGKEYRVHSFELGEPDNRFSVDEDTEVDILVVGGGGGGGGENTGIDSGGGGGGGGIVYKQSYEVSSSRDYEVSVGDGGNGGDPNNPGNTEPVDGRRGEDTVFDVGGNEIVAYGGGGGAYGGNSRDAPTYSTYGGGGGGASSDSPYGDGAPATSQGNAGGRGSDDSNPQPEDGESDGKLAGGGGGGTRPDEFHQSTAGDGGDGGDYGNVFSEDFGEDGYFAGGGGGTESVERGGSTDNGTGGKGGGGDGRTGGGQDGTDGTGGGGGAGDNDSFGGKGGSGIVLVRVGPL